MAKIKYKFNSQTLSYEEEQGHIAHYITTQLLPKTAFSVIAGIALGVWATYNISSPLEADIKIANDNLKEKMEILQQNIIEDSKDLKVIAERDDNVYRAVFGSSPLSSAEREAGFGGMDRYSHLKGYQNSELMLKTAYLTDKISKQEIIQAQSHKELLNMVKNKELMLRSIPNLQPIRAKDFDHFGSPFGKRFHPILKIWRLHAGVDLCANQGVDILASGAGKVVIAKFNPGGYGNYVKIDHGYGYSTIYGHLQKILVKEGQEVKRGEVIGLCGNTGLSTAPHLHYEVREHDVPQNPMNYFKLEYSEEEYQKLLEASEETHTFE